MSSPSLDREAGRFESWLGAATASPQGHPSGSGSLKKGAMPVTCPICCSRETIEAFRKRDHLIVDCANCRHRYAYGELPTTHVDDTYSDQYFFGGGAGYHDYLSGEQLLRRRGRKYARKLSPINRGTVLDVGSAAGFMLRGFVDEEWAGTGVEPNETMATHARLSLGLNVVTATFEDFDTSKRYDLITMFQILAHFANPRLAIEKASRLLVPGGLLLVETWNRCSLAARFAGAHWHEYNPPSVLHWFSMEGLKDLTKQFRFTPQMSGRMIKWISGGHAKSVLSHTLDTSAHGRILAPVLKLVPDGLAIPYPGDDLYWIVFQKTS
jgi:SAM-dependent methyltransferase